MVTATLAVWILVGLAVVLALVIPVLDSVKPLSNFISLRWTCIAIILLIMVGVIINFNTLSDSTRDIALTGGLIIVGVFIVLRTIEKVLYNGWLRGVNLKAEVSKGDIKGSVDLSSKEEPKLTITKDSKDEDNLSNEEDATLKEENE